MKSALLFVLLLSSCLLASMAQGSYSDCCLGHIPFIKKQVRKNIQSYTLQSNDGDCNIGAVIFVMKKRANRQKPRTLCTNPDEQWVQDLMREHDSKQGK